MPQVKATGILAAAALIAIPVMIFLADRWDWATERMQKHPGWTWALMVLLLVIVFILLGLERVGRWDGILIDETNRMSLSRLQALLWATILVSGIAVGLAINFARDCQEPAEGVEPEAGSCAQSPWDLSIPDELVVLAGISAATLGLARVVHTSNQNRNRNARAEEGVALAQRTAAVTGQASEYQFFGVVAGKNAESQASWSQLVTGDIATNFPYLDLSRVQQLVLTVVLAGAYAALFLQNLGVSSTSAVVFPGFDDALNILLGISGATYVGVKAINGQSASE